MSKAFARIGFVALLALAVILAFGERAAAAEPLPALGADESRTSVSGLSSGAYMAGQFQIAYSKLVIGAGLVAGGPYGCASRHNWYYDWVSATATREKRNLGWALVHCMQDGRFPADGTLMLGVPGATSLAAQVRDLAAKGRIDDFAGIASDRIYLFSSTNDETVRLPIMELAEAFYQAIGVPKANIAFVKHTKEPHAFVTETQGPLCGERDEAYITDCDYNQAKAILETFYGPSEARSDPPGGQLLTFDQMPFRGGPESGMADDGAVYVPQSCADGNACAVHVVFHGCKQDSETIHRRFIDESGFVPLAAAKGIVLLFPRIKAGDSNPNGCWDWWGYSSDRFLERDAPQMAAVRKMIARLTAPRS